MNEETMNHPALEHVKYRILAKPYSSWRAILAETGQSDTDFLRALREIHGIIIDKKADETLYVVQDTQQMRLLAEEGVPNPTLCQIVLTAKAFGKTQEEAADRWLKAMQKLQDGIDSENRIVEN